MFTLYFVEANKQEHKANYRGTSRNGRPYHRLHTSNNNFINNYEENDSVNAYKLEQPSLDQRL